MTRPFPVASGGSGAPALIQLSFHNRVPVCGENAQRPDTQGPINSPS